MLTSSPVSRPSSTASVTGHGVAMHLQGDLNGTTCHICKEQGHYLKDCPKYEPSYPEEDNTRQSAKKPQGGGGGGGGTMCCSLHGAHSSQRRRVQSAATAGQQWQC